jgi:hypothetical protein
MTYMEHLFIEVPISTMFCSQNITVIGQEVSKVLLDSCKHVCALWAGARIRTEHQDITSDTCTGVKNRDLRERGKKHTPLFILSYLGNIKNLSSFKYFQCSEAH